jgi:hypothetical protein
LTRQSILFQKMDARVKPAHDGVPEALPSIIQGEKHG